MKKLLYSKKIIKEVIKFTESLETDEAIIFSELINNYCSKLNKEYARKMNELSEKIALDEKLLNDKYIKLYNDLIDNIAKGENLNSDELKTKYLNCLINKDDTKEFIKEEEEINDDGVILDKIIINGNNFYYEKIQGGKVYNASSEIVGIYNDNKVKLNSN